MEEVVNNACESGFASSEGRRKHQKECGSAREVEEGFIDPSKALGVLRIELIRPLQIYRPDAAYIIFLYSEITPVLVDASSRLMY